jgi:hypothetical protein
MRALLADSATAWRVVDRTAAAAAEITTLRQELAAAKARIQEMGDSTN